MRASRYKQHPRIVSLTIILLSLLFSLSSCVKDDFLLSSNEPDEQPEMGRNETRDYDNTSITIFNIENPIVGAYLDTQYDENDYTYTHITDYVTLSQTQRQDVSEGFFIEWQNYEFAKSTQIIYSTNSDYEDAIAIDLENGVSSYMICNLIPNNTYWVKIVNDNTTIVKDTVFSTLGRRRLINLSVGFNCRDIGGIITSDNKRVKYGLLFRGGELDGKGQILDDFDHTVFEKVLKIKDVFDFRSTVNGRKSPIVGADYHSIPLYSMVGVYDRENSDLSTLKLNNYKAFLESFLVCLENGRPVFVHCQGGCDRTNTMTFLILGVLGVGENDLALDYELSSFAQGAKYAYNYSGGMIRSREPITNKDHNNYKDAIEYIKSLSGETLKDKFESFWLNDLGVSPQQISLLREYMLTANTLDDDASTTGHSVYTNK